MVSEDGAGGPVDTPIQAQEHKLQSSEGGSEDGEGPGLLGGKQEERELNLSSLSKPQN